MTTSYYHPPDTQALIKARDLARRILHLQAQHYYLSDPEAFDLEDPSEPPHWLDDPTLPAEDLQDQYNSAIQDLLRLLAPDDHRHWDRVLYGEDPTA